MKSFLAISLAFVLFFESLLPKGVGMEQAFKMSELVSHFQQHLKDSHGTMSFSEFLWLHYSADSSHKKNNQHENLPNFDSHSLVVAIVLPTIEIFTIKTFTHSIPVIKQITTYKNTYSYLFSLDLLNPPQ